MKTTTTTINGAIYQVITATTGFVFRRKSDGVIFGSQITLGYNFHVSPPVLEVPTDFEEIKATTDDTPDINTKITELEATQQIIIEALNETGIL